MLVSYLFSVLEEERRRGSLVKLNDDVIEMGIYELKKQNDKKLKAVKTIQMKIAEERMHKIVMAAWAEVCGASVDLKNMTEKEKELFRKLVDVIKEFKKSVL